MKRSSRLFWGYISAVVTYLIITLEIALFHNTDISTALEVNAMVASGVVVGCLVYWWLGRSIQ